MFLRLMLILCLSSSSLAFAGDYGPNPSVNYGPSRNPGESVVRLQADKQPQQGSLGDTSGTNSWYNSSGNPYSGGIGSGWYGSSGNPYSNASGTVYYSPADSPK